MSVNTKRDYPCVRCFRTITRTPPPVEDGVTFTPCQQSRCPLMLFKDGGVEKAVSLSTLAENGHDPRRAGPSSGRGAGPL